MYTFIGFLFVFILAVVVNYIPVEKRNSDQKLIFHISGMCFHVHNWLISIFLISFAFIMRYFDQSIFNITIGGLFGFMAEDFLFGNEFVFKVPC